MPTLDHFGAIAPLYERLIPLRRPERLIARAGLPVNGWLLDVGGGTGRVAGALTGFARQVLVVDESEGMLKVASAKAGLGAVRNLAEQQPFPPDCFDRIIMVDALHHLVSAQLAAREMWRVLRPGGRIVIEEPDIHTLPVKLIAFGERLLFMRSRFWTAEQIAAFFPDPGASVRIEREDYTAWVIVEKLDGSADAR